MPALDNARLPFQEQINFFRGKLGNLVPTATWTDLWKSQHDRAFMVAGAMKADLLADMARAVDAAISEGKSIQWFRANFDEIVEKHGWAYRGERSWRSRVSAAQITAGIHWPLGSSAVRQARAVCSALSGSPNRAACSSPALVRQRASPE